MQLTRYNLQYRHTLYTKMSRNRHGFFLIQPGIKSFSGNKRRQSIVLSASLSLSNYERFKLEGVWKLDN
ncbi:hypothetical protein BS78_01G255100 [Paspalum vaginatum]|nr:hypothetical protein BS78_01G255100 [Paspalum vaginatum]